MFFSLYKVTLLFISNVFNIHFDYYHMGFLSWLSANVFAGVIGLLLALVLIFVIIIPLVKKIIDKVKKDNSN